VTRQKTNKNKYQKPAGSSRKLASNDLLAQISRRAALIC